MKKQSENQEVVRSSSTQAVKQTMYIARRMRESLRRTGAQPKKLRRKMDRSCWDVPRSCVGPMGTRAIGIAEASRKAAASLASCAGAARTRMVAGSGVPPGPAGTQGDVVKKATDWPTWDFSIKTLAEYLGFYWRDTHPSGAASIEWFQRWVEDRNFATRQRTLDYNEDDCRATRVLRDTTDNLAIRPGGTA